MPEDAINGRALATYSAIQTQTHSHAHCITEFTVAVHIFFYNTQDLDKCHSKPDSGGERQRCKDTQIQTHIQQSAHTAGCHRAEGAVINTIN